MIEDKNYYIYANDVVNGKIVAGSLMKLACSRFLKDLKDERFIFKEKKVDKAIKFVSLLKHYKSGAAGKPFILEPWQEWIFANIWGFYWADRPNIRKYTSSYIQISRKQGKSALMAAMALYGLFQEASAEVDILANSREQSRILFEFCAQFAKQIDPKAKDLKVYRDYITFDATVSKLKCYAANASKLDGLNSSLSIIDELHEAKDFRLYNVMKSSMGQRQNPHIAAITTAGFNMLSPAKTLRDTGSEVLNGLKTDDSAFYAIYELDEDDDWEDEKNWLKCAPNMNVTVSADYMRNELNSAKVTPSLEVSVRTKTFNMWVQSSSVWIPDIFINKASKSFKLSDFKDDDECLCYMGIDLAAVSDLTAVSVLLVKNETYYFKTHYYLPESALQDKINKDIYRDFHRMGYLKLTSGNVTDYDYVINDIMKVYDILPIRSIAYDSWNSTQAAIKMTELGLPLEPFSQAIGNFNRGTKELERLILSGQVIIDNNPITRWCFRNVALKEDYNSNVKPIKGGGEANKIDGVIAMIQSLGRYLEAPRYSNEMTII